MNKKSVREWWFEQRANHWDSIYSYNDFVEILDQMPEYAIDMGFDSIHFEYAGEMDDKIISESLIDGLKPTPMFIQQNNESILVSPSQAKMVKLKLKEIKRKSGTTPFTFEP